MKRDAIVALVESLPEDVTLEEVIQELKHFAETGTYPWQEAHRAEIERRMAGFTLAELDTAADADAYFERVLVK